MKTKSNTEKLNCDLHFNTNNKMSFQKIPSQLFYFP